MPFAVERRPLKPGEEKNLWRYAYDNAVAESNYPNLFELFKSYHLQGHLPDYGLTEVEYHFHKRMLRDLYKTEALKPTEILTAYRHFKIPIDVEVRRILEILCDGVRLRCNRLGELQSWKFPAATPVRRLPTRRSLRSPAGDAPTPTIEIPRTSRRVIITGYVEVRMWRHLEKYAKTMKAHDVLTERFWAKMKLHWRYRHLTPKMLLAYFFQKLRHRLYYLRMDAESKVWLIHHLSMKPTRAHIAWMLRVDRIFVELGISGYVKNWRLLAERRSVVQMVPYENYAPIKQYEPRPYFFYEARQRAEALLNDYRGLKADVDGIVRIPTRKDREREPEEFATYVAWVEETKKKLNPGALSMTNALDVMRRVLTNEENQKMCDCILMQLETEWLQADMQKIFNILETMNPSIPTPPLKDIEIHKSVWPYTEDQDVEGYDGGDEIYEKHDENDDPPLNYFFFKNPVYYCVGGAEGEKAYLEYRALKEAEKEAEEMEEEEEERPARRGRRRREERQMADSLDDAGGVVEEHDEMAEDEEAENRGARRARRNKKDSSDEGIVEMEDFDYLGQAVGEDVASCGAKEEKQPSPPSPTPLQESELIDVMTVSSDDESMARRLDGGVGFLEESYVPAQQLFYDDFDFPINPYERMLYGGMPEDEFQRIDELHVQSYGQEEDALYYIEDPQMVEVSPSTATPPTTVEESIPPNEARKRQKKIKKEIKKEMEDAPIRRSSRIAAPKKEQEAKRNTFSALSTNNGVFTFGPLQFFVGKDGLARKLLPEQPEPVVYQKIVTDTSDIVKYYAKLEKPPISFEDQGISFVRDGARFEVKLSAKSKEAVKEERGRRVNKTNSCLQMLCKRRAMSPGFSTQTSSVKSRRMSSTRNYSPSSAIRTSSPRRSNDNDDYDVYNSALFARNRGIFPVVQHLDIPPFHH